jgi:uncharacterized protein YbcI
MSGRRRNMPLTREAELDPSRRGGVANAISNMMVRLLSEYAGRGPTSARTYIHDDLVTVVMHNTLTKAEHRLVEIGQREHVRSTRRLIQDAMRDEAVGHVEELMGRKVIAFLSDNHMDPDLAVETLLLEPRDSGENPETGDSDPAP